MKILKFLLVNISVLYVYKMHYLHLYFSPGVLVPIMHVYSMSVVKTVFDMLPDLLEGL